MESLLSDSVTLVVKSPAANIRDQHVEARLDWTVEKLKGHLEDVFPNKPKTQWQKLIYCGRLLSDRLLLRDIFRHLTEGEVHTVHLVCSTLANSVCKEIPPAVEQRPKQPAQEVRHRRVKIEETEAVAAAATPHEGVASSEQREESINAGSPVTPYSAEYVQCVQNMYAHYWQQMATWQSVVASNTNQQPMVPQYQLYAATPVITTGSDVNAAVTGAQNTEEAEAAAAAAGRPAAAAAAAQQRNNNDNVVLDAQGRVMVDEGEEGEMNDWLDWVYVACRVAVILSIIYFYSSMGRFLMVSAVIGLIFVLYILRRDWQQEARAANNLVAAPPAPPADGQQQGADGAAAAGGGDDTEQAGDDTPPPPPRQPTALETLATFLYNFFASLVPEMPQN